MDQYLTANNIFWALIVLSGILILVVAIRFSDSVISKSPVSGSEDVVAVASMFIAACAIMMIYFLSSMIIYWVGWAEKYSIFLPPIYRPL